MGCALMFDFLSKGGLLHFTTSSQLVLSLKVTAQRDMAWHGTKCEALVGMDMNVH